MKLKVKVEQKDNGWEEFRQLLKDLNKNVNVRVGVLGEGIEREGQINNAELAAIHEFGTQDGRIPERSFMRSTMDKNRDEYIHELKHFLTETIDGKMTIERAFGLVGAKIASDIKGAVTEGAPIPPPNVPSVVARKQRHGDGAVRTLVDTGRMVNSITWEVITDEGTHGAGE